MFTSVGRRARLTLSVLGFLVCCFTSALEVMPLWADLQHATAQPDGLFRDHSETGMIVLLQELGTHSNMRFTPDGQPAQQTVSGMFERSFKEHFGLSSAQYACITDIFDRCALSDIAAAVEGAVPPPPHGVRPTYNRRCFTADADKCCGLTLRARSILSTVYDRDDCFPAWNIVKQCRYGCGTRYLFDKRIVPGIRDGRPCSWHVYGAWTGGNIPSYVASKSGHAIISTRLLRDVAITQATNRAGFQTIADVHNHTVGNESSPGTVSLSGPVLLECFSLYAALKYKQCRGPWWWNPPPGEVVEVDRPQEVAVFDYRGGLSGSNYWVGLHELLDQTIEMIQGQALWTRHSCDGCCQDIEIDGHVMPVRAATMDGITAVRFQKCSVHGCQQDRRRGNGRFCDYHHPVHTHRCAIREPPCLRPSAPGRLACDYHRRWEDSYNSWNRRGGWHVRNAALRQGQQREPLLQTYLRSCFAPRHTFGYQIVTASCGIIHGLSPLFESEGDLETAAALDDIYRVEGYHPTLLFFDKGCSRRRHVRRYNLESWYSTIVYVDRQVTLSAKRFHARNHHEQDCLEFCNPENKDDPLLWRMDDNNRPRFRFNSSIAESTNSFIHGLGPCVSKMSRVLNRFVLTTNMLVHNEMLLSDKLLGRNPVFRA